MSESTTAERPPLNPITRDLRTCPSGQWKVARANGVIEVRLGKPTMKEVAAALGAKFLDTVNLRDVGGRITGVVMLVDDIGFDNGKPVNKLATEIYHAQCRPGTTHPICGDVAIVNDADFEA
jgi:hypothetical protein